MYRILLKRSFLFVFIFCAFGFSQSGKGQSHTPNKAPVTVKANNPDATCTPDSAIFTYTGAAVAFTVPSCVTSITVNAWGGGGGGGGNDSQPGGDGGGGAFASSTLTVTPGQVLSIVVGGGGGVGAQCADNAAGGVGGYGYGAGGTGGIANDGATSGCSGGGGGGGGATAVLSNGAPLIVAGGGAGGGGGGANSTGGAGGASAQAGGTAGGDGFSAGCFCNTSGGTGGAVGGSSDSVGVQGVNCTSAYGNSGDAGGGGGGGGGYSTAGGGGDASPNCDCGGGGGAGGNSLATTVTNGSGQTVGNSGYATLPAGSGSGGTGGAGTIGTAGGNGYLVISYCVPISFTLTTTQQNLSCYNSNDGWAAVHVTGGVGPFTYSWNTTPAQTNDSAYGLPAGTYTVTVSNGSACDQTAVVTITQPAQLRDSIASFTNVSVACGSNGTATVGVTGGDGNYTYSWNTSPVQTSATASNLVAGNYTVTVTDATCVETATVTIGQPGALTASIASTTPALCNGTATGSAIGTISGGTAPYIYSWSNGTTGAKDSLLSAGNYTVSITDANKCTQTAVATITQPAAIRDSIAKTINILCNGQTNGQAIAGVKGGTGAYTYSWNTAPVQTGATATGLAVGAYTVTVADANGCKDSAVANIAQPAVLELTASPFAATCFNVCNGSATVIPSGGTQPYKYVWSNGASSTSANVTNLCAGTYSVIVTDANGCTHDTTNLTVTQPPAITFTKTETASFCNKPDGEATVTISGGTPPYLYAWSNGQTSTQLTNVKPGSYCFGVEDANKCEDSVCVIIGNIPGETASITSTTPTTCNGGNNGKAIGTATGGTQPYTYSWSTAPPQTADSATGLSAATYTLTVTDSAGCVSTATASVTQPALVVTTVKANPVTICYGGTPSNLTATSTGGNGTYNYIWRPDTTVNNDTTGASVQADPKTTLTYTVITTDGNNCPAAPAMITVMVDPPLSVTVGQQVATCPGGSVTLTATAIGGNGNYIYTWNPATTPDSGASVRANPASTGYYTVTVSDGCTNPDATDSMKVIVDPLPVVKFTADTINGCSKLCVTFADASTISSGGIKSWKWSFGDGNTYSGNSNTNKVDTAAYCYPVPGIYSVTEAVTSDSGCTTSVTQNNMITVYSHPNTNFTPNPATTTIEQPGISFIDQTTDAYGVVSWSWETFGDLSDSSAITKNAMHTYTDTGTFCVKLVTVNKYGCADSITKCVIVNALYTLYIPNAFTPNSDGRDDIFAPVGTYFTQFEMYIFNRWGSPIYHTTDITKGWIGSVNNTGPLCMEDTYVYLINVTDFKGTPHSYLGRVTLVK